MNKTFKRAAATAAVCAATAALTLPATPATAGTADGSTQTSRTLTKFGYQGWATGSRVKAAGVEMKTLRDAYAAQSCTRLAGVDKIDNSLASVTDTLNIGNDLVHVSPSTSRTSTYVENGVNGVRAVNTIADIAIGGDVAGVASIPTIKIQGLQTVADAFHDAAASAHNGYGSDESFGFSGIGIDYQDTVVDGTPLAQLLDIVNSTTETVSQQVNDLVQLLLEQAGQLIKIPGLGSIGLGGSSHAYTDNSAMSQASGLVINVDKNDQLGTKDTRIVLGRARSVVSGPVTSGVFRSSVDSFDLHVGDDLLHIGGVDHRIVPCTGIDQSRAIRTDAISLPIDGLGIVNLSGIKYDYMAKQLAGGKARTVLTSQIGDFAIPAMNLEIKGLVSKMAYTAKPGEKFNPAKAMSINVDDVLVDGSSILNGKVPVIGDELTFVDSLTNATNVLDFGKAFKGATNRTGSAFRGILLTLPGVPGGVTMDLGSISSHFVRNG